MTNIVTFPGLGLEFHLDRVAFSLFGHPVYWYGVIIGCGFLLAVLLCCRWAPRFGVNSDQIMDLLIFAVPLSVVGLRVYYVLFYLDLYREADGSLNWGAIFRITDGGLAIYGGIIAAALTLIVFCRIRKISFFSFADLGVHGLLIGQCIGRWGNFMNREAFGAETTLPWRMQLTTVTGQLVEVHPTFLYESLWNLAGLLLIIFVVSKARRFDGENTWFYFLWYGIGRFWIEGLRTDSLYLFNWTIGGQPIRVSQALSLVMVFVSLFMLYYNIKLHPHKPEELYVNIVAARNAAAAEAAVAPAAESPAQATPTEDAPAVSSEPEAPSQKDTSGETPTEDPS